MLSAYCFLQVFAYIRTRSICWMSAISLRQYQHTSNVTRCHLRLFITRSAYLDRRRIGLSLRRGPGERESVVESACACVCGWGGGGQWRRSGLGGLLATCSPLRRTSCTSPPATDKYSVSPTRNATSNGDLWTASFTGLRVRNDLNRYGMPSFPSYQKCHAVFGIFHNINRFDSVGVWWYMDFY